MATDFEKLLELANSDPRRALDSASRIAGTTDDLATRARALRVQGLAFSNLGEFREARASLEEALRQGEASGDRQVLGETQMTRAAVLAWEGEPSAALEAISQALLLIEGPQRAKAQSQRGAVHYRLGNFSLARSDLDVAIRELEASEESMWAAHALTNRGLLNAYEGLLPEAERDLMRARQHYASLGQRSAAAEADQNLGWLALRSGDFPQALNYLDEAEATFEELGKSLGQLWCDRAEALLAAHLATDAKEVAARAASELRDKGLGPSHADALIHAAQAALLSGDTKMAAETARAARNLLEQQGRSGWVAFADYLVMRARAAEHDLDASDLETIKAAVQELDNAGLKTEAVHARLLAASVATEAGDYEACRDFLIEAARARKAGPVELRVQGWLADARLRLYAEDNKGASTAARAGLRVLDDYQATLGGTMARLHVTSHGAELAEIGLRLARESGSPRRLFKWMELTRAGALRSIPSGRRGGGDMTSYLMQFREADEELRRATLNREATHSMAQRRHRLQEKVRNLALKRRATGSDRIGVPAAADVLDLLGPASLIEFGQATDDTLLAVRLEAGVARKYELGPLEPIRRELDSLAMSLRRLAVGAGSEASRAAALAVVAEAAKRLDTMLVTPLRVGTERTVIVPIGPLYAVPWGLLPSLQRSRVVVSPSAALWARRAAQGDRKAKAASVIAGPRLEHSATEVDRVSAVYRRSVELVEPSAAEAARAIDGATVAHVACHGSFRADNPLFSSLEMADGPLTVYDLESLEQAPEIMVLSACDAGANTSSGGHEVMGLATALLGQGTRSVVANVGLVPDQLATIDLMVDVHRGLIAGKTVAAALAAAFPELDYSDPEAIAARAFVTFGA